MATAEGYEEKQVILRFGHGIRMFQQMPNFAETLPHLLEQEFTFPCQDSPSSWSVRVELQREPGDGGVSSEIVIKRTDSREISFNTELWMGVSPGKLPDNLDKKEPLEIYCIRSVKYTARGMSPGFEAKGKITRLITNDALKQFCNLSAQLRVFFLVRGCHTDKTIDAIGEFVGPLTEREMSVAQM